MCGEAGLIDGLENIYVYTSGDFCRSIECRHNAARERGDILHCEECMAYRMHNYIRRVNLNNLPVFFLPLRRGARGE